MLADHCVSFVGLGASGREPGGEQVRGVGSPTVDRRAVDRTNLHRIWKAILIGVALAVATACYFAPVLLVAIGALLVLLGCARRVYAGRGRYIPNLFLRNIRLYQTAYPSFLTATHPDLRRCKIR